jgi:hypothetical protein
VGDLYVVKELSTLRFSIYNTRYAALNQTIQLLYPKFSLKALKFEDTRVLFQKNGETF